MANSYAFVLSKNTYPDAFQANLIGVDQGTRIVYSATNTLTSESVLYADSRLTQPIYGNPDLWLGVQLLTDDNVKYPINVSTSGSIEVGSVTTTTTTTAPTTTTTTVAVYSDTAITGFSGGGVCSGSGNSVTMYYTGTLGVGTALYTNAGLTVPYLGETGNYVRLYFAAQYNVCYVSGVGGDNTISSASAC